MAQSFAGVKISSLNAKPLRTGCISLELSAAICKDFRGKLYNNIKMYSFWPIVSFSSQCCNFRLSVRIYSLFLVSSKEYRSNLTEEL